jgi:chemotaxis protein CheD
MKPAGETFLNPGEVFFGQGHVLVGTLLGSCVAVTLWHRQRHLGGMCHFLLPQRPHISWQNPDGRYADEAFALLDRAIARCGTRTTEYEAKLFGGGNMFPDHHIATSHDVSENNIRAARRLLEERCVALKAEHVGGTGHRRLYFDAWTGEVWLSFHHANKHE